MRFAVIFAGLALAQTSAIKPQGHTESSCVAQPSIWKQGIEFRHALCPPGIDVEVSPIPVPGFAGAPSPLAYYVGIHNYSEERIETDPTQWHLLWTEKKGTPREDLSLTARKVGISRLQQSFGRSTLLAGESATGFVYFKKPKAKDAVMAIVVEPDEGGSVIIQIPVSGNPLALLPLNKARPLHTTL